MALKGPVTYGRRFRSGKGTPVGPEGAPRADHAGVPGRVATLVYVPGAIRRPGSAANFPTTERPAGLKEIFARGRAGRTPG